MNLKTALIDLHYLPSLEYFNCLQHYEQVVLEANEHFIKQTYRNRCYILGANQVERLGIPVEKGRSKVVVKDLAIDNRQRWVVNHWKSITSAYGKAPFFEHYEGYFRDIFFSGKKYLFEFNWELLTICLKLLKLPVLLSCTEKYGKTTENGVIDLRSVVHPKKGYQNNEYYQPYPYNQIFGKDFVANLSIIDLLFCEGPNAMSVLNKSLKRG